MASPPAPHPSAVNESRDLDRMELEYPAPSLHGQSPTPVFLPMPKFVAVESDHHTFYDLVGIRVWFFTEIVDATSGAVDPSCCESDMCCCILHSLLHVDHPFSLCFLALQKVFDWLESHMALLLKSHGEVFMETDLWHMVNILVAQAFVTVEEQLVHYYCFSLFLPFS